MFFLLKEKWFSFSITVLKVQLSSFLVPVSEFATHGSSGFNLCCLSCCHIMMFFQPLCRNSMATDCESHLAANFVCKIWFCLCCYGIMMLYSTFQLLSISFNMFQCGEQKSEETILQVWLRAFTLPWADICWNHT